jgi:conjugal transfer pilus assembly protein TraE
MLHTLYSNSLSTLKKRESLLGLTCAALSVSLVIAVSSLAMRRDRVVVVPPGLSGPVAVDWGRANAEYMKTFAVFYSTLLGTITPRNAEYVADRLSGMTSPTAYPLVRKSILAAAKDPAFLNSGSTMNFVSNSVVHENETGKVFVLGEHQVYSGFGMPKVAPVVYELDIRIAEGRPVVMSVTNYPGTDARTKEWKQTHPGWDKPKDQ